MQFQIDEALYPDCDPPPSLERLSDKVDYLARLCSAWDFSRLPDSRTIEELQRPDWREAIDETRLLTSPAYHLLRRWHGLPELPYLGQRLAYIDEDPSLEFV